VNIRLPSVFFFFNSFLLQFVPFINIDSSSSLGPVPSNIRANLPLIFLAQQFTK
jgi:hypothetical protein